jgi:hypothetical protein
MMYITIFIPYSEKLIKESKLMILDYRNMKDFRKYLK